MEAKLNMRPAIRKMNVGEELTFPIQKLRSIRTLASELGAILDRDYVTRMDRIERVVTVIRNR